VLGRAASILHAAEYETSDENRRHNERPTHVFSGPIYEHVEVGNQNTDRQYKGEEYGQRWDWMTRDREKWRRIVQPHCQQTRRTRNNRKKRKMDEHVVTVTSRIHLRRAKTTTTTIIKTTTQSSRGRDAVERLLTASNLNWTRWLTMPHTLPCTRVRHYTDTRVTVATDCQRMKPRSQHWTEQTAVWTVPYCWNTRVQN